MAWGVVGLHQAWRRGWLHHARPVRWSLDLFGNQVLLACGLLISSLVASGVAAMLGAKGGTDPSPAVSFWCIVASAGVTIGVWRALSGRGERNQTAALPLRRAVTAGVVGLLVAWPLISLVTVLGSWMQVRLGGPPAPETAHQTLEQLRRHSNEASAWALGLALVFLTPLAEELVWRGAVQQALKGIGLHRTAAVTASATLFALVHWSAVPPEARLAALPALALLGVTLGWLMERCGRIAAPYAAHAAFNLANLLLFSMLPG